MAAGKSYRSGGRKRRRTASGTKRSRTTSWVSTRPRRRINARTAGFLGIEKKFFDTSLLDHVLVFSIASAECNPSSTVTFNAVPIGDGESERDGRKLIMKHISVKGRIHSSTLINQTVAVGSWGAVIYLVLDQQCNGANLNSEDVFKNPSGNDETSGSLFRNLQYQQRFKILAVRKVVGPYQRTTYDGSNLEIGDAFAEFAINVNLGDIPVNFSGTTSTVANIVDNCLHLVCYKQSYSTQVITLSYNARLRYVG